MVNEMAWGGERHGVKTYSGTTIRPGMGRGISNFVDHPFINSHHAYIQEEVAFGFIFQEVIMTLPIHLQLFIFLLA
jgi:hypothetical protein